MEPVKDSYHLNLLTQEVTWKWLKESTRQWTRPAMGLIFTTFKEHVEGRSISQEKIHIKSNWASVGHDLSYNPMIQSYACCKNNHDYPPSQYYVTYYIM